MIQLLPIVLSTISLVATGQSKFADSGLRVHCYIPATETRLGVEGETDGRTIWLRAEGCRNLNAFVADRRLDLPRIFAIELLAHESSHVAYYRQDDGPYFADENRADCRALSWLPGIVRRLGGTRFQARLAWQTISDLEAPSVFAHGSCGGPGLLRTPPGVTRLPG